ncbi:MAG TPA: TolC family protein, partial [Longimicrobiaceae bacterium]
QAARLEADRARTQRAELERQVEMQVRQAHDALRTAGTSRAAADARLAAARRTWELVSRRWEEGIAPHVEFVDARTAYTAAGLNAVLTRYDHALRYVELERAAALRALEP